MPGNNTSHFCSHLLVKVNHKTIPELKWVDKCNRTVRLEQENWCVGTPVINPTGPDKNGLQWASFTALGYSLCPKDVFWKLCVGFPEMSSIHLCTDSTNVYWDPTACLLLCWWCTGTKRNFLKSTLEELIVHLEECQKQEVVITMQYQQIQCDKYSGNL